MDGVSKCRTINFTPTASYDGGADDRMKHYWEIKDAARDAFNTLRNITGGNYALGAEFQDLFDVWESEWGRKGRRAR
ncbi:hypothetical protein KAU11_11665 [Candidatus Babeliales bacterium]|nr:hypothetical protein [Candidatus Babeliales bacterium]